MDRKSRSLVKSLTWRITGIILLGVIAYLITGNMREMTIITILFHSIRFVLYYFHERLWERISWGKITHPLAKFKVKDNLEKEDLEIIRNSLKALGYLD